MRALLLAVLASCAAAGMAANDEKLAGSWAFTTNADPSDFFSLELIQQGHVVCGRLSSTTDGTNKIDSSYVIGKIDGGVADVQFESRFNQPGQRGTARLALGPAQLDWRVTQALEPSTIWPRANLLPQAWNQRAQTAVFGWCAAHWKEIEAGSYAQVRLQP